MLVLLWICLCFFKSSFYSDYFDFIKFVRLEIHMTLVRDLFCSLCSVPLFACVRRFMLSFTIFRHLTATTLTLFIRFTITSQFHNFFENTLSYLIHASLVWDMLWSLLVLRFFALFCFRTFVKVFISVHAFAHFDHFICFICEIVRYDRIFLSHSNISFASTHSNLVFILFACHKMCIGFTSLIFCIA